MLLIFQFFINLPSEGKTTKEANMSGSIQAVSNYFQSCKTNFEEKYTRFTNWTSENFAVVKKTARAFFESLANVLLWPLRSLANVGKATFNYWLGSMAASRVSKPEPAKPEELPMNEKADASLG